jgi:hypothetical protein
LAKILEIQIDAIRSNENRNNTAHNNDTTTPNSIAVYFQTMKTYIGLIASLIFSLGGAYRALRPLDFAVLASSIVSQLSLSVQELHQSMDKHSILNTLIIRTVIHGYGKLPDPIQRLSYMVIRFGYTFRKTPIFASKVSAPMTTSMTTWMEFVRYRPLIWSIGSTMEKSCTLAVFRGLVAVGCGHPAHIGT